MGASGLGPGLGAPWTLALLLAIESELAALGSAFAPDLGLGHGLAFAATVLVLAFMGLDLVFAALALCLVEGEVQLLPVATYIGIDLNATLEGCN